MSIEDIAAPEPYSLVGNTFGSRLKAAEYVDSGVPVLRGVNLSGPGKFNSDGAIFVTEAKADELRSQNATAGDIIFTQQGSVGQVGLIPKDSGFARWVVSQSQMKLRPDPTVADPLYTYFYFRQPSVIERLRSLAVVTGVPHINLGILRTFPILLPPLAEQRAIAHILGALEDKTELNRHMNETLEAMTHALFQSWFVNFDPVRAKAENRPVKGLDARIISLFPDAFEETALGQVPRGWAVSAIGNAVRVVGGSTPRTQEAAYWKGGEIQWATPKDLSALSSPVLLATERRITNQGLAQISSGLLPRGTVLLSSRAPVGYLAIAEVPTAINQGFIAMVCDRQLSNQYVLHWAQQNLELIKSRANGTTFQEISKANFRPLPVLVPPAPLMARFTQIADSLYQQTVRNLQENLTLAALRNALLPKLLLGEIRVQAADKTVEAALA